MTDNRKDLKRLYLPLAPPFLFIELKNIENSVFLNLKIVI